MLATMVLVTGLGASNAMATSEAFGECLARSGATFFGASWCPVCDRQRRALGPAMSGLAYVECSIDGKRKGQTPDCKEAGIRGYPTWIFGDGSRASGSLSLERLAAKSGCSLDGRDVGRTSDAPKDAIPVRRSRTGGDGALVIEIP